MNKRNRGVLREVMSELKPKEVGIGTIGDVQGERIAGRRGDKPGELKSRIGSV